MRTNRITNLTKKMVFLIAITCFSIFPSVMIFGKKGVLIVFVLFYWTIMTSYEIEKLKRKNGFDTISSLMSEKNTKEYKMLESNDHVKDYLFNMSQSKIVFYAAVFGGVMALISVFIYFVFIGLNAMLF